MLVFFTPELEEPAECSRNTPVKRLCYCWAASNGHRTWRGAAAGPGLFSGALLWGPCG